MNYKKPLILVTNDDGINAPGLRKLIQITRKIGRLVVVAPDKSQSGMGHAITVTSPLRLTQLVDEPDFVEYVCNGTPVDCVKLGLKAVLKQKPDLIVSGINHGSNASVNILYSGTMAAVLEAAIENIPAIGLSLNDYSLTANFDGFEEHIQNIIFNVIENGLPPGTCLNVNIPAMDGSPVKGVKVVKQGSGFWDENYIERIDPFHRHYYWLTGVFRNNGNGRDTDTWALQHNYIAVVPVQIDLTAHRLIPLLKKWKLTPVKSKP